MKRSVPLLLPALLLTLLLTFLLAAIPRTASAAHAAPAVTNNAAPAAKAIAPAVATAATDCGVQTDLPAAECAALLALYNSTDGPNWTDSPANGWNQNNSPCSWTGVNCNSGHVWSLLRGQQNLVGTLPAEIANLTDLNVLRLDNNHLTGPIPAALGGITNLTHLGLGFNQLTGTIPVELAGLTNLMYLELLENKLTGTIPPGLGGLANLQELWLAGNLLTGPIPPELANLVGLRKLILSNNKLTGPIPVELASLTELTTLFLHKNQLVGLVPPELGTLTNLEILSLDDNLFTGAIPVELANLINLTGLGLGGNNLQGTIPAQLSSLAKLKYLRLTGNHLGGTIPPALGGLPNLLTLDLSSNELTGTIPPELGNLTSLENLLLQGNALVGEIPPELSNLTQFTQLSQNQLRLEYNGLYTPDAALSAFLEQRDAGWYLTQTVPPVVDGATPAGAGAVDVHWTPISYKYNGGFYQVLYATQPGGPYTPAAGVTADKLAAGYTVSGLQPATPYYFVVRTVTPAHFNNASTITSTLSSEVSAVTAPTSLAVAGQPLSLYANGFDSAVLTVTGAPGASVTLTHTVGASTISPSALTLDAGGVATTTYTAGLIAGQAAVLTDTVTAQAGTLEGTVQLQLLPNPLELEFWAVAAGERITYTAVVTNSGAGPQLGTVISGSIPGGTTFLLVTGGTAVFGAEGTYMQSGPEDMAPHAVRTMTWVVAAPRYLIGTIPAAAEAESQTSRMVAHAVAQFFRILLPIVGKDIPL